MALTHTMTLTDDQAELLAAWSKAELDKHGGHAPAAAYVLNSLIQSHLVEWVRNKWRYDRERKARAQKVEMPEPEPEPKSTEVITLWRNGPTLAAEDFATMWNASAYRKNFVEALRRHLAHTQQDEAFDEWLERLGERNSLQRLTLLAKACRAMGFDLKRAGRSNRR